jgi:hypothetical protein
LKQFSASKLISTNSSFRIWKCKPPVFWKCKPPIFAARE